MKEKELEIEEQARSKEIRGKLGYESVLKIAMAVKNNFTKKNIKSIFLDKLVTKIKKTTKSTVLTSKEEIKKCILDFCKLFPNWISLVDNYQGTLVRLKSKQKMGGIVSKLKLILK